MRPDSPLRRALPWLVLVGAVLVHGWFDVRQRARLDRGVSRHRTDFTVYLAASEALAKGDDPYEARSPRGWRYVYPPLLAILVTPLLGLPVPTAALVFYALSVGALVLAYLALVRSIGPPSGRFAAAAAFVLAAPFLLQTLQRGQVTALLLATQAVPLALLLRGRDAVAGLVLAFGIALRLTPVVPAALLGLASLRTLRSQGFARFARFPAGLVAGLALFFVAVPALALGPARAREVTAQWVDGTRSVYAAAPGQLADLQRDYGIREDIYKNQGARRVLGAWLAPFDPTPETVDAAALALALLVAGGATVVGWRTLADRSSPAFRRGWALAVLVPVFLTRYAWPIHYVVAIPFLAECLAGRRPFHLRAAGLFAVGAALFYVGHASALRFLPQQGVLFACALVAAGWFAARTLRPGGAEPEDPPPFRDDHPLRHLHRALRWRRGGLDRIAELLPRRGLVVDLGAGEGLLAHRLVRRSPDVRVLAVDHDAARLERLSESARGCPIETRVESVETASPPRCDGIALVDVLHYLERPAQDACLRRAYEALTAGGTLVLRDPDAAGGLRFAWNRLYERLATALGLTKARIGAYRSVAEWEALLASVGFETRTLPRAGTVYADRVVVGVRPKATS